MRILPLLVAASLLFSSIGPAHGRGYARSEFKIWADSNQDCRNTRQEILIERSLKPVTFRMSRRGACTVKTGRWQDFYFDEVMEDAAKIDIDHVVPLKHAWDIGAAKWTAQKKSEFGNDPENLVITDRKYNRQKGAKTILEWMPIDREYACRYAARWFRVKAKYDLPVSKQELEHRELLKCEN